MEGDGRVDKFEHETQRIKRPASGSAYGCGSAAQTSLKNGKQTIMGDMKLGSLTLE